jgi:hypothetical protein
MTIDEQLKRPFCLLGRHVEQGGGSRQADVWPVRCGEHAERAICRRAGGCGVLADAGVADGETRTHRQVPGLQFVQAPARVAEPASQRGHAPSRTGDEAHGGDADGQRQAAARGEHRPGRLRLSRGTGRPGDAREQRERVGVGEAAQLQQPGGLQVRQRAAAGDHDGAARRPGSSGRT